MKSLIKNMVPNQILDAYREKVRQKRNIYRYINYEKQNPGHYYSLAPFDYYKCIFVHVPKCGGISVSHSLFGNSAGVHSTIQDYQRVFHPKTFKDYFKFTFVRNPWDRLVSAYFFLVEGGLHSEDDKWAQKHISHFQSFDEFVRGWVNNENIQKGVHFLPQVHFLFDQGGQMPVDFVGTFERINEDYKLIAQHLGIEKELPHYNKSKKRSHYKEYYSDEARKIVARVYDADIKAFGYRF